MSKPASSSGDSRPNVKAASSGLSKRPIVQVPTTDGLIQSFRAATGIEPRPHQVAAVLAVCTALTADCHKETPSNYLCQHATGSGKSLTMAMLAHALTQLVDERGNRFALVVVVSDRRVLDEQNGETLSAYFGGLGDGIECVPSCARLRELLSDRLDPAGPTRVAAATLQKAARHRTAAAAGAWQGGKGGKSGSGGRAPKRARDGGGGGTKRRGGVGGGRGASDAWETALAAMQTGTEQEAEEEEDNEDDDDDGEEGEYSETDEEMEEEMEGEEVAKERGASPEVPNPHLTPPAASALAGGEGGEGADADEDEEQQQREMEEEEEEEEGRGCRMPRVVLLADEAHRSHGHSTTEALHALLCGDDQGHQGQEKGRGAKSIKGRFASKSHRGQSRHVSYVSFSATPSEPCLRLFGVLNHAAGSREAFHSYSLRQALSDGHCVDVLGRYTTVRPALLAPSAASLREVRAALSRRAAGARRGLFRAKAEHALEFARSALGAAAAAGFDAKAMMVVRSRLDCVLYQRAMLQLLAEEAAAEEAAAEEAAGAGKKGKKVAKKVAKKVTSNSASASASTSTSGEEGSATPVPAREMRVLSAFSGSLTVSVGAAARSGGGGGGADDDEAAAATEAEAEAEAAALDAGWTAAGVGVVLTERGVNGCGDVLEAYRAAGPALIIVCNKLETGFDEPRVSCVVVDRVLRGAHAVQVLGRANRVAPGKPAVRVLDFANSAAEIGAAFAAFADGSSCALGTGERRLDASIDLAFISEQVLACVQAGSSAVSAAAAAVLGDRAAPLAHHLSNYLGACSAAECEVGALPFGFAQRLLEELHAASAAARAGGGGERGGGGGRGGGGVEAAAMTTTFSGRIPLRGARDAPRPPRSCQKLSNKEALHLTGEAGGEVTLDAAVSTAREGAQESVRSALAAASAAGGAVRASPSEDDLALLSSLTADDARCEALLLRLLLRAPPTAEQLKRSKAGMALKRLSSHARLLVAEVAAALIGAWRDAVGAEARGAERAKRLQLPGGAAAVATPVDAVRRTAACQLAEAMRGGGSSSGDGGGGAAAAAAAAAAGDGALAMRLEAHVFTSHGSVTDKAYKAKCRTLASMLRAPRASSVRQGMRAGELSVAAVCALDPAEVLQSDAQKEAKQAKRERDDRGIESVRIKNLANQSAVGAFRCKVPECDGKEAIAYGMSSMGLETPASGGDRPSVVYECLTCGDRSSE